TIDPGETTKTFTIPILDDNLPEGNESFRVRLTSAWEAELRPPSAATITIIDNDVPEVSLSVSQQDILESGGQAIVTATLNAPLDHDVTVDYATSDGSATAGADYQAANGTLTIPAGQSGASIAIPISDDQDLEGEEDFSVELVGAVGVVVGEPSQDEITIVDDDVIPEVSFSPAAYQIAEDGGAATIGVVLSRVFSGTVAVEYATAGGTATSGVDYLPASGTLTFAPGTTAASFQVTVLTDQEVEGDETVDLQLSNVTGGVMGSPDAGVLTILGTPGLNYVRFSQAAVSVSEGDGQLTVSLVLDFGSTTGITVDVTTADGTAVAGEDYSSVTQTVSFAPDETTAAVTIPITGDALHEADETFHIALASPVGAFLGSPSTATATILDDDAPPVAFLCCDGYDTTAYATGENLGLVTIPVHLSEQAGVDVTVDYATSDDTAVAGSDYTAQAGTLTFAPGETEKTISIPILADSEAELPESFDITLSNPVEAALANGYHPHEGSVTVVDTLGVSLQSAAFSGLEGSSWSGGHITVWAQLADPVPVTVTVNYATADGTAIAGQDYTGTSGTLTFLPNHATAGFNVYLAGNEEPGEDKKLMVTLSNATGAELLEPSTAELTIIDDDQPRAYDLRVLHVGPDLVHLMWNATSQASSFQIDRRDADAGGAWTQLVTLPSAAHTFWRDLDVTGGARYEYQVTPFASDGTPGPEATIALDAPVPAEQGASVTVIPGMAEVQPPATPLPEHANAFAGRYDYIFHLTPDPGPQLTGCTVDVYVDGEPAPADPDEPFQPLDEPYGGRARDELGCVGTNGTRVVEAQPCDGATCDVLVPNLTTGIHTFLFVLTDASGKVSRRAIVQDMQPWWPVNKETTGSYPSSFPYVFSDRFNVASPVVYIQGRTFPAGEDSLDCGDMIGGGRSAGSAAVDLRQGLSRRNMGSLLDQGTYSVGASTDSGTFGRHILKRGSPTETVGGFQEIASNLNAVATNITVDVSLPVDVPPAIDYVTPTVVAADASTTIHAEIWIRVIDDDQDVDPDSVTVQNITFDGGAESFPAYYADPWEQDRAEGRFGWFVCRVPLLAGSNDVVVHAADRAGHTVDESSFSVERIVAADGSYPVPVISAPAVGRTFFGGLTLPLDASASTVPSGYQVWLGVLEEGSGDPMQAVFETDSLTGSFTAADRQDPYVVRLVIATPAAMPAPEVLRAEALPCALGASGLECAATEVFVRRGNWDSIFEVGYAFPEVVFLRWGSMWHTTIQRSDDGGVTWKEMSTGSWNSATHDRTVEAGHTYYYRLGGYYLGSTFRAPGEPVHVPDWQAPRVIPSFGAVIWNKPQVNSSEITGTVELHLEAEPGGTLAGSTIRLFLNEDTFQEVDGMGDELKLTNAEWPWISGVGPDVFSGRDAPGCVVRKGVPDMVINVPADQDTIDVTVPGVVYGADSFRFEVLGPNGGYSERALLRAILRTAAGGDSWIPYATATPYLFGTQLAVTTLDLEGFGPTERRSPDCADGDMAYDFRSEDRLFVTHMFTKRVADSVVDNDFEVTPDVNGRWGEAITLADGEEYELHRSGYDCWPTKMGEVGRKILAADGSVIPGDAYQWLCGSDYEYTVNLTVDTTLDDGVGHAPVLQYVQEIALNGDIAADGTVPVRFRVTDLHQDVDLSTITVTNQSLDPPVTVPGYYAWAQSDDDHGDFGWLVAEVPVIPDAENHLLIHVEDLAGNVTEDTGTVTLMEELPPPVVSFSSPTFETWEHNGTTEVTVKLSRKPGKDVTVWFSTAGGTASAGSDYTGYSNWVVTFHANETEMNLLVEIHDDTEVEGDETVNLVLSNAVGCTLGDPSTAVLTITDDDVAFDGLAPGQIVEGGSFRVYSHTLDGRATAVVYIDDDLDDGVNPIQYERPVHPGGYMEVTPDPAEVPEGLYYVAVAPTAGGQKSIWIQALDVVPAGSEASPLVVTNEEDESCQGPGTECAHPIVPGQTWQGEWGEGGDRDYFSFTAGAGVQVQATLDFIEGTEGIGDDSRAPDPEVTIVDPSGIYTFDSYADDRAPNDTNATLDWTTR
ncbi:MAG: hypothetical protein GXP47_04745, partial [Acidobacteria bacterium]|nr:hypothetical protein [Acidobacteriota bacterium]